jgi:hypothetical protein
MIWLCFFQPAISTTVRENTEVAALPLYII